MSDFGTAKTQVSKYTGHQLVGDFDTAIELAIIDAINSLRANEFPWNIAALSITPLVVGVADADTGRKYSPGAGASDLPQDFLQPLDELWIRHDTSTSSRKQLIEVNRDEFDRRRAQSEEQNGDPLYWTLIGEDLWITPAPDATTMEILGRYIKKLSTPDTTSADGFTSDWFEPGKGLEFVVQTACMFLRSAHLRDAQGAGGHSSVIAALLGATTREANRRTHTNKPECYYFGTDMEA